MLISYNLLKELTEFDYSSSELEHLLTMLGLEVESVTYLNDKYKNFVTAYISDVRKHPETDKLSVCRVSTGDLEFEVVCGASNVKPGTYSILGLPGAILPRNNATIEKRMIRNIESVGMLCSLWELDLGDDQSGIWILDGEVMPGISLAELKLNNDIIFEIGITPNRADCLSHLGIAREIAAITSKPINKPRFSFDSISNNPKEEYEIIIKDIDKCPRYSARIIRGLVNKPTPEWLKLKLETLGFRSLNSIVDVTNYVLILTGQPLHAFDLKKISGKKIIVKTAYNGEKFITLDGKERELDSEMLMICDTEKSIAIGGVMGGENSEIDSQTTDILLESAYFDPKNIRKTSKKLAIQSEASYRFERGVDPNGIIYSSNLASNLIQLTCGGVIEEPILDSYPKIIENKQANLRFSRARKIIGFNLSDDKIINILERLNFKISNKSDDSIEFTAPSYRVDINSEIDAIEEIARLYNYDNIEPDYKSHLDFKSETLPTILSIPPVRQKIRNFLVYRGFFEILTQNQTHPKFAKEFHNEPIYISNPLGEDLSVMRTSLIPSMLKTIALNINFGSKDLRLFEIGKIFYRDTNNPLNFIKDISEKEQLIIGISGLSESGHWSRNKKNTDFYDIKGIAEEILEYFRLISKVQFNQYVSNNIFTSQYQSIILNGEQIGAYGQVNEKFLKMFNIETDVFILYLDLGELNKIQLSKPKYSPVSSFPGIYWDLAFLVDEDIKAMELRNAIIESAGNYLQKIDIFDIYTGKNIEPGKKSIAFSLYFQSSERTLTDSEIQPYIQNIEVNLFNKYKAVLRKA